MTVSVSGRGGLGDWEYARKIELPFILNLESGVVLRCEEILRLLPGKRLVCRAAVVGQPPLLLSLAYVDNPTVLVKLFMGSKQQTAVAEDALAVQAIAKAGISTPKLVQQDKVVVKGYPVLLFEFLDGARPFWEAWQSSEQQSRLLRQLLEMLAVQHAADLRQRDFHLMNYLVGTDAVLYAIDGGDYALGKVSKRMVLHNLGMLFGHLPRDLLLESSNWLDVYTDARGWSAHQLDYGAVLKRADRFRHHRARRITRKCYRNCSEFLVRKYGRYFICQRRDFDTGSLDKWLDQQALSDNCGDDLLLKSGNSQTVWRNRIENKVVVVKRYNLKSWIHALRRAVTRSRASRSWGNAHHLQALHIATPVPLAMVEERLGPLRRRAWLLMEWCTGADVKNYFAPAADTPEIRADMQRVADVVLCLGKNGVVHHDLKATNFLIQDGQVDLIDLDSMSFPVMPWIKRWGIAADQRRFLANWTGSWLQPVFKALLSSRDD